MTTSDPVCVMCQKPESGHKGMRHPFTLEGQHAGTDWLNQKQPEEAAPVAQQIPMAQFPFDPVLRLALINKGLLTADDLTDAEKQITAIGGVLNGH